MNISEGRIIYLVSNYCKGKLSKKEAEELKIWLKEDSEHQKKFKHYHSLYGKNRTIDFLEQMDKEKSWSIISNKISPKTRKLHIWLPYAASVAVIAVISVFLFLEYRSEVDFSKDYNFAQVAEIGSKKAVLTLADGSKMKLHERQVRSISEVDGTQISKDSTNTLSYSPVASVQSKLIYNRIEVPRGGEYSLTLSDGTKVWLNAESELRYPVNFRKTKRDVFLIGEAYFEVAHNKEAPFTVHIHDSKVKVLGTKFNISGYEDQEFIATTLVEGSVEVNNLSQKELLKPGYQSIVNRGGDDISVSEVDTHLYTSWVEGVFEFEVTELEYIMAQLGRWYNVKFFFNEESLKHIRFTGAITRDKPIEFALKMIEKISDVDFAIKDDYIIVGRP
jgi:transmembrane sensor